LILKLKGEGYRIRVTARNRGRLHQLLQAEGISYNTRGPGSRYYVLKYVLGAFLVLLALARLLVFRPGLSISRSSPYLILASRILRIPSLCFDDNDTDLRLQPWIRLANYIITPATYSRQFHECHFRIPVFKEMAYLPEPRPHEHRKGFFIRISRTDTTHHSRLDTLDLQVLNSYIGSFSDRYDVLLSSEYGIPDVLNGQVTEPGTNDFYGSLNHCRIFWGNSATMAAEAALLGIPAVYVSANISSSLVELKEAGLLFHFTPDRMETSLQHAEALMESRIGCGQYCVVANWIRKSKIDMGAFLYWVVSRFPDSVHKLQHDPDWKREFGE
jgi:predicted glycosyltransferase